MSKKAKIWHIQDNFYIIERGCNMLDIIDPDQNIIRIDSCFIKDVIDALGRAYAHYENLKLAESEAGSWARWGKERTPAEIETDAVFAVATYESDRS
jgi:hypothetical protein